MILKNANVLIEGQFQQLDIQVIGEKIHQIAHTIGEEQEQEVYDCSNCYIVPGFIDIHTHGAYGHDINHANASQLNEVSQFFATQGVTSFLGSILTDTKEQTLWCIQQLRERIEKGCIGSRLIGIHLEGPFLSEKYKGAMPLELLKYGEIELIKEYQKEANGFVRYITIAPEVKENMSMIKELCELGIKVSMGHSDATYEQSMKAIEEGVTCATHLMNAMRPIHQHEIGIVGAAFLSDIFVETIIDGLHLVPDTLKLIAHNKGLDKIIGITDCIMATGLPDGSYQLGINDVEVKNGDAKIANTDIRAGSTLQMSKGIKNLCKFLDLPLEQVVKMITSNPAKMLGLYDRGKIECGLLADLVVLDQNLSVVKTIVGGNVVYNQKTAEGL